MDSEVLIVGAGLTGAIIGRELAEAGQKVRIVEARSHVAGNCHTERDPETGVMVHVYGPHIFHTGDPEVWAYVNAHQRFRPYAHRVRAVAGGRVHALPINLLTINQFFGETLRPDEARAFLAAQAEPGDGPPVSFEECALGMLGRPLYEAFFKGYTQKQWGCEPADLPASILTRLPVRFDYNDAYFAHPFQGLPEGGYTAMVTSILDHPGIRVDLNTPYDPSMRAGAVHVFWSGPLDDWFGQDRGRLAYRTLDFERFTHQGDWQGCAVMNYCDAGVPWTRITEHKHFAPWENHESSVLYREYSRAAEPGDIPYYPVRLVAEKALLREYAARAEAETGVSFAGRLGSYRYLDMDVAIREALDTARAFLAARSAGLRPAPFLRPPL
ncbi:UDP-galactopyranose/dTDP-fucopyranose mutase family protein [Pararhodobacter aggregans]